MTNALLKIYLFMNKKKGKSLVFTIRKINRTVNICSNSIRFLNAITIKLNTFSFRFQNKIDAVKNENKREKFVYVCGNTAR